MSGTVTSPSSIPEVAAPAPAVVPKRPSRALRALTALAGAALSIATGVHYLRAGRQSTDDAQVESRLVAVAPRITGQVKRVLVSDNQLVSEGDTLVELDPSDTDARVAAARADVEAARASLGLATSQLALETRTVTGRIKQARGGVARAFGALHAARSATQQAAAELDIAASRVRLSEMELQRAKSLFADKTIAQAEVDTKTAEVEQARAALEQVHARQGALRGAAQSASGAVDEARGQEQSADTSEEQLAIARAAVEVAQAHLHQAEAARAAAELAASYTVIKAPTRGIVSRRSVEAGHVVSPDRPLLALVPPDDVWVVANFKEDELQGIRPGCPVRMTLDATPRADIRGHVDSIAGASGARFSLLPPDNASGNFVKVVQRVPVLIRFDAKDGAEPRPGMSVYVTVDTRQSK